MDFKISTSPKRAGIFLICLTGISITEVLVSSTTVASPVTNFSSLAVRCDADVPLPVGKRVAILAYSPQ